MARSIDWSLKKVFIREDLHLSTHSGEFFLSWKRQFNNFIRESGIKAEEIPWETKMAVIEAYVTSATFEKITAAQLQLRREQRQNIDAVLDVIATVAKAKDRFEFTEKPLMLISNKLTKPLNNFLLKL